MFRFFSEKAPDAPKVDALAGAWVRWRALEHWSVVDSSARVPLAGSEQDTSALYTLDTTDTHTRTHTAAQDVLHAPQEQEPRTRPGAADKVAPSLLPALDVTWECMCWDGRSRQGQADDDSRP